MLFARSAILSLGISGTMDSAGERLVVCSFRTGDLELFSVDLASGDAVNQTTIDGSRAPFLK